MSEFTQGQLRQLASRALAYVIAARIAEGPETEKPRRLEAFSRWHCVINSTDDVDMLQLGIYLHENERIAALNLIEQILTEEPCE